MSLSHSARASPRLLPACLVAVATVTLVVALGLGGAAATDQPHSTVSATADEALSWSRALLIGVPASTKDDPFFDSVACPSTTMCLIVGNDQTSSGAYFTVIEQFNGRTWSRLRIGLASDNFDSVACATQNYCVIVGETTDALPLAEIDDSGSWSRSVIPVSNTTLTAVATLGVGSFIVAGEPTSFGAHTSSWRYADHTWRSIHVHPQLQAYVEITSMSCVSATDCVAVGHYGYGGPAGAGLAFHYDGATWEMDLHQNSALYRGGFGDVSCSSGGTCVATEDLSWLLADDSNGQEGILVSEYANGTWTTLGRGLPTAVQLSVDEGGVQCFSSTSCLVVAGGERFMYVGTVTDGHLDPLTIARRVRLDGDYPWLTDLSCATPGLCVEISDNDGAPFVLVGTRS